MATRERLKKRPRSRQSRAAAPRHSLHYFWIICPLADEATLKTKWDRYNRAARGVGRGRMGSLSPNHDRTLGFTGTARLSRAELQVLVDEIPGAALHETWPPARGWQGET